MVSNGLLKLITVIVAVFPTVVFATVNGFYTGIQLGETKVDRSSGNLNAQNIPVSSNPEVPLNNSADTSVDNDGFGGRAYVGYQFFPHLALEGGYTQYADTKIKNIYGIAGKNEQLDEGALDSVMKLSIPLFKRLSLYGKGGASFVMTEQIENVDVLSSANSVTYQKESVDRVRPTYAVGLNWDFTRYLSSDLSWTQVSGGHGVPTSDLMAIGVSFHLPNKET